MKKHRNKPSWILSFFVVLLASLIVFKTMNESNNMRGLDAVFSQMHRDRLEVEGYIYQLNEILFIRKIELMTEGKNQQSANSATGHDKTLETQKLLALYERTRFTAEERHLFDRLKTKIHSLYSEDKSLSRVSLLGLCNESITILHGLSAIQLSEGRQLAKESSRLISGSEIRQYFDLAIYLVGLSIIIMLLRAKRSVDPVKRLQLN